jgi:hypothetical protein
MTDKDIKIVFEPGCFDAFDGTQEELDELLAEIQRLVETGEIFEQGELVTEEMPDWIAEKLLSDETDEQRRRKLN